MGKTYVKEAILNKAVENALYIIESNLAEYTDEFPDSNSTNGFYKKSENIEWTTGFCTGEYWLAWELGKKDCFRNSALKQVDSFLARIENRVDVDHHDMGFLYSPSCVAAYRLTGSETGRKAALMAADNLTGRFHEKGEFIQAWGALGASDNYRMIIDCLMNLPLLYFAAEETKEDKYRDIALRHTKTSLRHLVRQDNSTYHTYFFDPETGEPIKGVTAQGYRDGSAWARGQAWGIYGTAIAYKYSKEADCIRLFEKITDFFLSRLPEDLVPYWDLDFKPEDKEPRDSSAAAIAICGMLEMCPYLPEDVALRYREAAGKITEALIESYAVTDRRVSNGLLLHGVYAKKSPYNTVTDRGVDECNLWGDYFYLEALARWTTDWTPYW